MKSERKWAQETAELFGLALCYSSGNWVLVGIEGGAEKYRCKYLFLMRQYLLRMVENEIGRQMEIAEGVRA